MQKAGLAVCAVCWVALVFFVCKAGDKESHRPLTDEVKDTQVTGSAIFSQYLSAPTRPFSTAADSASYQSGLRAHAVANTQPLQNEDGETNVKRSFPTMSSLGFPQLTEDASKPWEVAAAKAATVLTESEKSFRQNILLGFFTLLSFAPVAAALSERKQANLRSEKSQQVYNCGSTGVQLGNRASRVPVLAMSAAAIQLQDDEQPVDVGTATPVSSAINLSKNMVGSGVLVIPAGVAAFSASPLGLIPATSLMLSLGCFSAYSFITLARCAEETGSASYRDIWANTIGEKTSAIPGSVVVFKTAVNGLSYAIILGDSLAAMGASVGLPRLLCQSNPWILGLTATVLLPLSLMRNLSSLAVGSLIGTAGTLYTAIFMWLRWFDGSYAVGGKFFEAMAKSAQPFFAAPSVARPLLNPSIFVLVSMLATCFLAHYNAPKFYRELAPPKDGGSKQNSFNKVILAAFGSSAVISAAIMISGFLTFGGASQGLILNCYSTMDPLAFIARLGIVASMIFTFPLNFVGLRDGAQSLLKLDGSKSRVHLASTFGLLGGIIGLSLVIKNLGAVIGIAGAALGSSVVYTMPALMFIQATRLKKKNLESQGKQLPVRRLREMYANYGIVGMGLFFSYIGVKMCLLNAGAH